MEQDVLVNPRRILAPAVLEEVMPGITFLRRKIPERRLRPRTADKRMHRNRIAACSVLLVYRHRIPRAVHSHQIGLPLHTGQVPENAETVPVKIDHFIRPSAFSTGDGS